MNYERKTPSTYRSTPSVYSHVTGRSNLQSQKSRGSMKSVRIPWYQRPLLKNNEYINIQKGAVFTSLFSLFVSLFTIASSVFDIYCLAMAAPGSTHYGYYFISYEFVYVGNRHVRNGLVVAALFSFVGGCVILVTTIMLLIALRKNEHRELGKVVRRFAKPKEYEKKIVPWLYAFAAFTSFRILATIFYGIVNDLIFAYNVIMLLLWIVICFGSVYGWLVVYSLYLELVDLTKLEDLAHLRMGTMASLHASTTHSLAGSRPTTPHSTVSTMPVG